MDIETLRAKYAALAPVLSEGTRRLWAAAEAEAMGHGGGRKRRVDTDGTLLSDLNALLEPITATSTSRCEALRKKAIRSFR